MKKRWLSVILIVLSLCLVLPIVAACGGGKTPNTDTSSDSTDTSGGNGGGNGSGGAQVLESKSTPVVKFLRIAEIGNNSVTVKFNLVGEADSFEIRTGAKQIKETLTESELKQKEERRTVMAYADATVFEDYTITGDGAIKTVVLNGIKASANDKVYIAVKAQNDFGTSALDTVRAGGIEMITLDHNNPQQLYNGEKNGGLIQLIDEQTVILV